MRLIAAIAAAVVLGWAAPAAARVQGALSGSLGSGVDTNPAHIVSIDDASEPDLFGAATASARVKLTDGARQQANGRYELGLKKFWREVGEDVAVQQADAEYSLQFGRLLLGAGLGGKLRLSRGGARDYADGLGELFADWAFTEALSLRLSGGGRGFWYRPDEAYGSLGPQLGLSLRYTPSRRHAVTASLIGALPAFAGDARPRPPQTEATGVARRDRLGIAQLTYGFRGPLAVQGAYNFVYSESNSYGESSVRHRLSLAVTARLPWELFGMVQAAWQYIRYPDHIYISPDLLLLDDESQSSAAAKLAYPLSKSIDLEARYAVFFIALPPPGEGLPEMDYLRHVATLGASARF